MAVLHFHQGHTDYRGQAHRLRYLAAQDRWDQPDPFGLTTGLMLTGIGLALLAGFAVAEFAHATPADFLLIFFGCPFLVFGGILLLLILVESIFRRLKRIQSHCGRCRFYQPLDAGYTLGRCRVDPRERVVQRANACRFFDYSERAMVRDRFAQQAQIAARHRGNTNIRSPL